MISTLSKLLDQTRPAQCLLDTSLIKKPNSIGFHQEKYYGELSSVILEEKDEGRGGRDTTRKEENVRCMRTERITHRSPRAVYAHLSPRKVAKDKGKQRIELARLCTSLTWLTHFHALNIEKNPYRRRKEWFK